MRHVPATLRPSACKIVLKCRDNWQSSYPGQSDWFVPSKEPRWTCLEPIKQLINRLTNQPNRQPTNQSTNRQNNQPSNQPPNHNISLWWTKGAPRTLGEARYRSCLIILIITIIIITIIIILLIFFFIMTIVIILIVMLLLLSRMSRYD